MQFMIINIFLIVLCKSIIIVLCKSILFNKLSKLDFFLFGIILGSFLVFIDIKLHDFYLDYKISILQEKNKKN